MKIPVPPHIAPDIGETIGADPAAPRPVIALDPVQFMTMLAEIATNAWKARSRLSEFPGGEQNADVRRLLRNVEAILSSLEEFQLQIKSHTGDAYDFGQAIKVVASEPRDGVSQDTVLETIRPTITWRGHVVQRGEVIVATPRTDEG